MIEGLHRTPFFVDGSLVAVYQDMRNYRVEQWSHHTHVVIYCHLYDTPRHAAIRRIDVHRIEPTLVRVARIVERQARQTRDGLVPNGDCSRYPHATLIDLLARDGKAYGLPSSVAGADSRLHQTSDVHDAEYQQQE